MEFMNGGSTGDLVNSREQRRLTEEEVRLIIYKLVVAVIKLEYNSKLIHRDLHNGQVLIHFPALESISDYREIKE